MNSSLVSALVYGLGLLIILSAMTAMGIFQNANLAMVDRLFQLAPNRQATPPMLLVSTTETDRNNPLLLSNLVAELLEYEPRSIHVMGHAAHAASMG